MDQRRPQLGSRTEPVCDYLRRPVAGRLSEPGVNVPKPGYGNGGKANCAFPPFPQPLLLTRFFRPTVYTKYLTLPNPLICKTSAVRFTDWRCKPHLIPPINRWAIFSRGLPTFGQTLQRSQGIFGNSGSTA